MRPILSLLPSPVRRRIRRRPSLHAVATAIVALVTGGAAYRLLDAAEAGAARYGHAVPVAVATRDLDAGRRLRAGDVAIEHLPARAVAPTALTSRSTGRVLRRGVSAGEPLVEADLGHPGASSTAALLPPGAVALAIPTGAGSVTLHRGDRVDLLALAADDLTPLGRVAADALVVATDLDAVTVAVPADDAAGLAAAVAAGTVVPALRAEAPE